jgi:hypothetical protein
MSSGNCTTEATRIDLATDERLILDAGLVRNAVLRRALAIAAYERGVAEGHAEDGSVFMLTWVMLAAEQVDKERAAGHGR